MEPWGVLELGDKDTDREAPTAEAGWNVGVHLGGGGESGCGV